MKSQEVLEQTSLDWKVRTTGIMTEDGLVIPNKIALVREDTSTILGIHSSGYVPYQNAELLELLFKVSQSTGLEIHSSGCFGDGEKVWFQLKSDNLNLPGGDRVEGFLSGLNSFDGSTSLAIGTCNLTISCQNTFWRGYHQVETKLKHSANMKIRIEEILKSVDVLLKEEKETFQKIIKLGDIKMTQTAAELVIKMLFDLKTTDILDSELSTRKKNQMITFGNDLALELASKNDSLWGLFSGVTRYTTHSIKDGDNSENKMFGKTGNIERRIFQELTELA